MTEPARSRSEDYALVVASRHGEIRLAYGNARRWMQRFFSCPPRARRLPFMLCQWIAASRQKRDNRPYVVNNGHGCLFVRELRPHPKDAIAILLELSHEERRPDSRHNGALTRREWDVLQWTAAGKSNWEMAQILGLSASTVGKHLEHIYSKLGVENRTAAARHYRMTSRSSTFAE